jgi:hypothetical protein
LRKSQNSGWRRAVPLQKPCNSPRSQFGTRGRNPVSSGKSYLLFVKTGSGTIAFAIMRLTVVPR